MAQKHGSSHRLLVRVGALHDIPEAFTTLQRFSRTGDSADELIPGMQVTVPANEMWFDTGVRVHPGQKVRIDVPDGQSWIDWFIKSGPEGRTTLWQAPFRAMLRVRTDDEGRRAEFFTLIVAIVSEGEPRRLAECFVIGTGRSFEAKTSGRLICFANDVDSALAYSNNRGEMRITIN